MLPLPAQCCGRCVFWIQDAGAPSWGICVRWPSAGEADRCPDMTLCSAFESITNNPPESALWGKARWGETIWTIKE